jgi:hypothetical protein
MNSANKALETLGYLDTVFGSDRMPNRIDDGLGREDFNSYLNGVDRARSEAQAIIDAIEDTFDPTKAGWFHPISPIASDLGSTANENKCRK